MSQIASGEVLAEPLVTLDVIRGQIAVIVGIQSLEIRTVPASSLHVTFVWTYQIVPGRLILACRWCRCHWIFSSGLRVSDHVVALGSVLLR